MILLFMTLFEKNTILIIIIQYDSKNKCVSARAIRLQDARFKFLLKHLFVTQEGSRAQIDMHVEEKLRWFVVPYDQLTVPFGIICYYLIPLWNCCYGLFLLHTVCIMEMYLHDLGCIFLNIEYCNISVYFTNLMQKNVTI